MSTTPKASIFRTTVQSERPSIEEELRAQTVGYVKHEDFVAARERIERQREEERLAELARQQKKPEKKKIAKSTLSFEIDDEEEQAEDADGDDASNSNSESNTPATKRQKVMKNPNVDTSFLPDREREAKEQEVRDALQKKWQAAQEQIKAEDLEVTYSFHDGRGHRRSMTVKKGNTIGEFLQLVHDDLVKDFPKLHTGGGLMYIKEDVIMPSHMTFYDFIVTKARGKSGPLFSFDVYDDVRLVSDASIETTASHPGKVVTRSWYEKNKTTFPACRWDIYDPEKKYEKYTIKS